MVAVPALAPATRIIRTNNTDLFIIFCNNSTLKENIMKRVIEIRAAEGGEDSKLFVSDLAQAYQKFCTRVG